MRVNHLSTLLSIITLLCTVSGHASVDDDTVLIPALGGVEDGFIPRARRDAVTPTAEGNGCITARGLRGICTTFRNCYPNLLTVDPDDPADSPRGTGVYNQELASILLNVSGVCGAQTDRQDFYSEYTYAQVMSSRIELCCPVTETVEIPVPEAPEDDQVVSLDDADFKAKRCGRIRIDQQTLEMEAPDPERIVNGREAMTGEFPWMVGLKKGSRQFCGGSLITDRHVLTAAHCVSYMTAKDVASMRMVLGAHKIYGKESTQVIRKAKNVYYHRGFSMKHLQHDISVIELKTPVKFTKHIQPVCLHRGKPPYDTGSTNADVAGWGTLYSGGPQSSFLRTVNVNVITQNECREKYQSQKKANIRDGMVCTHSPGKDSCQGDSGGPLTINTRGQATQIGIVSWGIGCAKYPGVYTRVDRYIKWIMKNAKVSDLP